MFHVTGKLEVLAGEPVVCSMEITNYGSTPAYNVCTAHAIAILRKEVVPDEETFACNKATPDAGSRGSSMFPEGIRVLRATSGGFTLKNAARGLAEAPGSRTQPARDAAGSDRF